ncbi:amidohydrolase [Paenibacillus sanguinis]|uniref:amidohydrolase n=1 Tax=Paenibacillus sanguinis TaxID=225906 RepID=UPI0003638043|nr:amidohydrolase [Paenibacillus sanguinis]
MSRSEWLKQEAAKHSETWSAMRRELHQYPELSNEEFETTKKIRSWLEQAGVTLLPFPLPTGVLAEIKGDKPGPVIMLRADIDALPIFEEADVDYKSKVDGKMHACGHDFHTTSMIGAATLLQARREDIAGTVRILFQPAEEIAVGAKAVIEAKVLDGVQAIFGMHNKPELPVGTIGLKPGPLMASVDRFEIEVYGKGGHAGIPNATVDPIVVSSAIVSALQTVISRNASPRHSAVVSVTRLESGTTWNVIPDTAQMEGTVRTFEPEARAAIPEQMRRVVEQVANGFGATAKLIWHGMLSAVQNDAALVELVAEAAALQQLTVVEAEPTMGGEDFALYQELVPGNFLWMGTSGTEQWHHPKFTLNEGAIEVSAALFAETALLALEKLA